MKKLIIITISACLLGIISIGFHGILKVVKNKYILSKAKWYYSSFDYDTYTFKRPNFIIDVNFWGNGKFYSFTRDTLYNSNDINIGFDFDSHLKIKYLNGGTIYKKIIDVKEDTITLANYTLPRLKKNSETQEYYKREEIWEVLYLIKYKKEPVIAEPYDNSMDIQMH